MIEVHAFTTDGRALGTRIIERDNISDRTAINMAFFDFAQTLKGEDLIASKMTDGGIAASLNLQFTVERKPCMKPAPSPSSPSSS